LEQTRLMHTETLGPSISARLASIPYQKEYIRLLLKRKPYLLENENRYLENIREGSNLDPNQISPALRFCETRCDYDLFDFLSTWSSFPAANRPGRRMKFFIVDQGQNGSAIMALGSIGSAIRQLGVRDEWIGWHGQKWKEIRAHNLAFIMDLVTCVGIPPYSYLTSGKLVCYTCLSREFRGAYCRRYVSQPTAKLGRFVSDIALIVVLGAFGRNTPQYKGVSIKGQNHFEFIGYTKGYSTFHIPANSYNEFLAALDIDGLREKRRLPGGANPKLRMLRFIARKLHLDEEQFVRSGYRRAVFAAPLARNSKAFLLGEDDSLDYFDYSFEDVVEAWKQKWLWRRWENREVVERIRSFTRSRLSLKREFVSLPISSQNSLNVRKGVAALSR
jgi:hypothetical protein